MAAACSALSSLTSELTSTRMKEREKRAGASIGDAMGSSFENRANARNFRSWEEEASSCGSHTDDHTQVATPADAACGCGGAVDAAEGWAAVVDAMQ